MPRAPAWCGLAKRMCCARRRLEDKPPPWLRGQGKGWVTAEYAMLPRATTHPHAPRIDRRQGLGPHAGNPAPDRPLLARRRRSAAPRRTPDHARLRCAASRWRHADSGDHRRLDRLERLPEMDDPALDSARQSDARAMSRRSPAASSRARRCSISIMPRIRPPRPTPIS